MSILRSIVNRICGLVVAAGGIFFPCVTGAVKAAAWLPYLLVKACCYWWTDKVCSIATAARDKVNVNVRIGALMIWDGLSYKEARAEIVDNGTVDTESGADDTEPVEEEAEDETSPEGDTEGGQVEAEETADEELHPVEIEPAEPEVVIIEDNSEPVEDNPEAVEDAPEAAEEAEEGEEEYEPIEVDPEEVTPEPGPDGEVEEPADNEAESPEAEAVEEETEAEPEPEEPEAVEAEAAEEEEGGANG